MSHKEKKKNNKKVKKDKKTAKNCKSECCKKYKKGEDKRCDRCPMFDLLKKSE